MTKKREPRKDNVDNKKSGSSNKNYGVLKSIKGLQEDIRSKTVSLRKYIYEMNHGINQGLV